MENIKKILFFICIFTLLSFIFIPIFKSKFQSITINQQPNQPSITKVKIAMGYIPNIQFAPFYVALDKGYFREQGIDIEFNYGWETDIIQLLAKNELQFAIASGDQVIIARSQDLAVISFFNWYQRFPVSICSLASNNIRKPQDLIGKTVGTPAVFGASYIGWQAFLKQNNLSDKQIKLQVIGYTQVPSLTEKKVDAAICYSMNEPVQLQESGYKVNNIEIADYINLVSNSLLTNDKTIKDNPNLINSFALAFAKGLKTTIQNPELAFEISKKYIPEIKDDQTQKAVLLASIRFWQADKLGFHLESRWQESVDTLKNFGLINKNIPLDQLFTNKFVKE